MKNLLSIVFCVYCSIFFSSVFSQERNVPMLPIGAAAPDFSLRGVDDKIYSLKNFEKNSVLVVVFWANHCPTAQAYEDRLIAMVNTYRPQGVGFVVISPNSPLAVNVGELGYSDLGDDFDDMVVRANDKQYNFPYLYDGDDHAASLPYGPVATPHVFIFDKERKLQFRGRIDDNENPYVEPNTRDTADAIEALLAGKIPEVQETRTFGCSIKWKWKQEWNQTVEEQWKAMPVNLEMASAEQISEIISNPTDKLILVNLWATWCGPCVTEFPELITIHRMYKGRDFELVTISADVPSRKENVHRFLQQQTAATRNYLYDSTDKYALMDAVDNQWQGALPHSLLIAPGGQVLARYDGIIDPLKVKRDIVGFLGRYFADDERE
jgi:thiol-disulfide isomerase/thioredoxin